MKRHPFDPVSFIFGLLFLGFAAPLLFSNADFNFLDRTWVFPTFLVVAGLIVLISAKNSSRPDDDSDSEPFT